MKVSNMIKNIALGLTGFAALFVLQSATVSAIPYNGPNTPPSPVPAFNVYTGAPAPDSNEANFLKARVPNAPTGDSTTPYVDPLNASCADGQRIQMRVYVHIGASEANNNGGSGPSVAHGTRVRVSVPGNEASSFVPSATISATNAASVNDTVTINCNGKTVRLRYINGSASSWSKGTGVVQLSDNIVTSGVPIRSQSVEGDVWGCWDDRVYVILSVEVEEVEEVEPVYSCDLLRITALGDRKFRFTVEYTDDPEQDVEFENAVFTLDKNVTRTATEADNPSVEYQYTTGGTKDVSVVVNFTGERSDGGGNCDRRLNVDEEVPEEPPVTTLVETGAGGIAGIFALTTAAGTALHKYVTGRRRA